MLSGSPASVSAKVREAVRSLHHPGFLFVNVGANDGVSNDPVYPFILELGWGGIAIEPDPRLFAELSRNYAAFDNVVLENVAISTRVAPFYYISETAGCDTPFTRQIGSLHREYVLKTIELMRRYQFQGPVPTELEQHVVSIEVPCLSFDALTAKHSIDRIDFINIDAEGADLEIFRSIDLGRYQPSLVCIETVELSTTEKTELTSRFNAFGYEFLDVFDLYSEVYVRRT